MPLSTLAVTRVRSSPFLEGLWASASMRRRVGSGKSRVSCHCAAASPGKLTMMLVVCFGPSPARGANSAPLQRLASYSVACVDARS